VIFAMGEIEENRKSIVVYWIFEAFEQFRSNVRFVISNLSGLLLKLSIEVCNVKLSEPVTVP